MFRRAGTLATLEQVTAIEERIAALEEAAAAGITDRRRALRHLADR